MTEPVISTSDAPTVRSPLSPGSLKDLLFSPKAYFADPRWLEKTPEILVAGWVSGIAYAVGRIDVNLVRADLGRPRPGWEMFGAWLIESWVNFWLSVLILGALNGVFFWLVGGWWYRIRLKWCGASDVEPKTARAMYLYQDFVASAPVVLFTIVETWRFGSYQEVWTSEELWLSAPFIFVFWSCVTSYKAATSAFAVSRWKARVLFLILPVVIYLLAFGFVATLFAFLDFDSGL